MYFGVATIVVINDIHNDIHSNNNRTSSVVITPPNYIIVITIMGNSKQWDNDMTEFINNKFMLNDNGDEGGWKPTMRGTGDDRDYIMACYEELKKEDKEVKSIFNIKGEFITPSTFKTNYISKSKRWDSSEREAILNRDRDGPRHGSRAIGSAGTSEGGGRELQGMLSGMSLNDPQEQQEGDIILPVLVLSYEKCSTEDGGTPTLHHHVIIQTTAGWQPIDKGFWKLDRERNRLVVNMSMAEDDKDTFFGFTAGEIFCNVKDGADNEIYSPISANVQHPAVAQLAKAMSEYPSEHTLIIQLPPNCRSLVHTEGCVQDGDLPEPAVSILYLYQNFHQSSSL